MENKGSVTLVMTTEHLNINENNVKSAVIYIVINRIHVLQTKEAWETQMAGGKL